MRADGKRVKNLDPMHLVGAHFMNKRVDAMNMTTIDIPYEPLQNYINEKRKEGTNISHMALIIAAYVRTLNDFPELNYFVVNKRIYERNEISIGMVVLQSLKTHEATEAKMYFEKTDTIFDVNNKINTFIKENRETPENNDMEKFLKTFLKIPGILTVGVNLLRFLDKHGLLPKSLIDISPFHMSMGITNLASIRTNHIFHHCYEFGTTSLFMAMGKSREVARRKNGEIIFEKCIPIGVTMDERICSGSYFASAFRTLKKYLKNPETLETPYNKNEN